MSTRQTAVKYAVVGAGVVAVALGGLVAANELSTPSAESSNPRITTFCTEFVPNLEASSAYKKWALQNLGERDKWIAYRTTICLDELPVVPVVTTPFGKALIAAGKMALTIDVPPPTTTTTTTVPPPTTTTPPPTTTEPPPTTTVPPPPPPVTLACGSSLDAAYDAASPGTVIELASCSYTGKSFTGSKASPGVVFDLNGSDQGLIAVRATWLEFRDGSLDWYWVGGDGGGVYAPSDQVTFRNIKSTGVYIDGGKNISMIGGEIGPQSSDQINYVFDDGGGVSSGILFDGVYVHDNTCVSSGCHYEALRIQNGANGVIIRNSVFRRNFVFDIFLTSNGTNYPKNVTMERNCFDGQTGTTARSVIAIHDPVLTSVDPAILRFTVKDNFAATGSDFRGPFWVFTGNTFGSASTCDTWIPGRSTP